MRSTFLFLLLLPGFCFAQKPKLFTEIKTDTIFSCGQKLLFKTSKRTLSNPQRSLEVSDFVILSLNNQKNDTLLAIKGLNGGALRKKFNETEEKDYSERLTYNLVSESILEITLAKSHYFEGAAHGEHWYETSFFNLSTKSYFDPKDAFQETAFPVINNFIKKDLNLEISAPEDTAYIKLNHISFTKEDLVISFHYLDSDSPVPVSYAQQAVEVYMPFTRLMPYLNIESPVYKMLTSKECR